MTLAEEMLIVVRPQWGGRDRFFSGAPTVRSQQKGSLPAERMSVNKLSVKWGPAGGRNDYASQVVSDFTH